MDYQTDQMPADPLIEEIEEGDSDHVEDTSAEVESDDIYVGRVFRNENEAYDAYHAYALAKRVWYPKRENH